MMLHRNIILLAGIALMLSGCAWSKENIFRDWGQPRNETSASDPYDIGMESAPVIQERAAPDLSYNTLASQYSNESVQMFSLDGASEPVRTANAGGSRSGGRSDFGLQGVPSNTDPSVTVFPFSDDMYTPGVRPDYHGYRSGEDMTPMPAGVVDSAPIPSNLDSLAIYTDNPNIIYFQHGSSALSATARQVIASVAQHDGLITVEGHASQRAQVSDPKERGILNLKMSMKRAMSVTKALIEQGVPPTSIKTTAYGEARPAVPEVDRDAEAKNRRVEIFTGAH